MFTRHSPRGGRHAADVITSDSLLLTDRPRPFVARVRNQATPPPVTAGAVRADREDRAQEFTPAGPDADTQAFPVPPQWWSDAVPEEHMRDEPPRRLVPPPVPAAPPVAPIQGFRLARLPVAAMAAALPKVSYPRYNGTPESYAAVMRYISVITQTRSQGEQAAAWPRWALEPVSA